MTLLARTLGDRRTLLHAREAVIELEATNEEDARDPFKVRQRLETVRRGRVFVEAIDGQGFFVRAHHNHERVFDPFAALRASDVATRLQVARDTTQAIDGGDRVRHAVREEDIVRDLDASRTKTVEERHALHLHRANAVDVSTGLNTPRLPMVARDQTRSSEMAPGSLTILQETKTRRRSTNRSSRRPRALPPRKRHRRAFRLPLPTSTKRSEYSRRSSEAQTQVS